MTSRYDLKAKAVVYSDAQAHSDFVRSVAWDPSEGIAATFKSAGWDGKVGTHVME